MKDFLGRTIRVRDILVYPHRRGSTLTLKKITVTSLSATTVHGTNDAGRNITISRTERSAVIPQAPPSHLFNALFPGEPDES